MHRLTHPLLECTTMIDRIEMDPRVAVLVQYPTHNLFRFGLIGHRFNSICAIVFSSSFSFASSRADIPARLQALERIS